MPKVLIKRGTRAQITSAANAGQLAAGECYLMTDEDRLAVGKSPTTFVDVARPGEGQIARKLKIKPNALRPAFAVTSVPLYIQVTAKDKITFSPNHEPKDTLVSSLGIIVTTSGAGVARLGIYDTTNETGFDLPGALLSSIVDPINLDGVGYFQQALTSPIVLRAGRTYWFASLFSGDSAYVRSVSYSALHMSFGYTENIQYPVTRMLTSGLYSTLPNTAPPNHSNYIIINGSDVPAIFMS